MRKPRSPAGGEYGAECLADDLPSCADFAVARRLGSWPNPSKGSGDFLLSPDNAETSDDPPCEVVAPSPSASGIVALADLRGGGRKSGILSEGSMKSLGELGRRDGMRAKRSRSFLDAEELCLGVVSGRWLSILYPSTKSSIRGDRLDRKGSLP